MIINRVAIRLAVRVFARIVMRSVPFSAVALGFLMQNSAAYGRDKGHDQLWQFYGYGVTRDIINSFGGCVGVLNVDTNPAIPGTAVEVYKCYGPNDPGFDSNWTVYRIRENGRLTDYSYIVNYFKDKKGRDLCLGVVGADRPEPGSRAEIYPCTPGGSDKGHDNQWKIEEVPSAHFFYDAGVMWYQLKNRANPNLCLGIVGEDIVDSFKSAARVEVYRCKGWIP